MRLFDEASEASADAAAAMSRAAAARDHHGVAPSDGKGTEKASKYDHPPGARAAAAARQIWDGPGTDEDKLARTMRLDTAGVAAGGALRTTRIVGDTLDATIARDFQAANLRAAEDSFSRVAPAAGAGAGRGLGGTASSTSIGDTKREILCSRTYGDTGPVSEGALSLATVLPPPSKRAASAITSTQFHSVALAVFLETQADTDAAATSVRETEYSSGVTATEVTTAGRVKREISDGGSLLMALNRFIRLFLAAYGTGWSDDLSQYQMVLTEFIQMTGNLQTVLNLDVLVRMTVHDKLHILNDAATTTPAAATLSFADLARDRARQALASTMNPTTGSVGAVASATPRCASGGNATKPSSTKSGDNASAGGKAVGPFNAYQLNLLGRAICKRHLRNRCSEPCPDGRVHLDATKYSAKDGNKL
jgi:hypothetical protein